MKDLLRIEQLSKIFSFRLRNQWGRQQFQALEDVSFSIREGETFGLVGESGSGKSTIANLIAGLLKPTSGKIFFEGQNITSNRRHIEREIQMVFQNPYNALNPVKRIDWILEEPLRVHRMGDAAWRKRRVLEMMEEVGLDESLLKRYPHELSGGQRQRIVIITALILNPKLVILDEAVSSLDVSVQAQILNLLRELQRKYHLSYLFISHDLRVVRYMSDRLAVLRGGRVLEIASAERIYEGAVHPYTQNLLMSLPMLFEDVTYQMDGKLYRELCGDRVGYVDLQGEHRIYCDIIS